MKDYNFRNTGELLSLCKEHDMKISEVMLAREMQLGEMTRATIMDQIDECLRVMDGSTVRASEPPVRSMGGLIGGEAHMLHELPRPQTICGSTMHKAIMFALAVAETNASMGVIVAAPTAGSAGVVPACILAVHEDYDISVDVLRMGLINAGAIGYLVTRNGSSAVPLPLQTSEKSRVSLTSFSFSGIESSGGCCSSGFSLSGAVVANDELSSLQAKRNIGNAATDKIFAKRISNLWCKLPHSSI